jgi:hypothetical protein
MAPVEVDMTLINELYEEIERRPPGLEARKLLVEQYLAAEWMDAVRDAVQELQTLCTYDEQVNQWHIAFCQEHSSLNVPAPSGSSPNSTSKPSQTAKGKSKARTLNPTIAPAVLPSDPTELASEKQKLITGYRAFRTKAKDLLRDGRLLQSFRVKKGLPPRHDGKLLDLEAFSEGRITTVLKTRDIADTSVSQSTRPPDSAREAARKMKADSKNAFNIAISDLEAMMQWLRDTQPASQVTNDALREAIAKRVRLMTVALPENLIVLANTALMHIEHESQWKTYVNDETMYGDPVPDIPRENFYATEDGYAWDMEELATAITSNKGVMRNPLSKHMFTPGDIKAILQHPHGQSLAALGVEQSKLKQGVRPKTLDEMDRMVKVLMEDMAEDALQSRLALDEFLAYIATLPEAEQNAIDNLRVPAKDSHTGQAFDGTIGEAVRDAKANKLCFHKAGEFLSDTFRDTCPIGAIFVIASSYYLMLFTCPCHAIILHSKLQG